MELKFVENDSEITKICYLKQLFADFFSIKNISNLNPSQMGATKFFTILLTYHPENSVLIGYI